MIFKYLSRHLLFKNVIFHVDYFVFNTHLTLTRTRSQHNGVKYTMMMMIWPSLELVSDATCRHQFNFVCAPWCAQRLLSKHPDAALIVIMGDFNKASLQQVVANFYQHITWLTRGENTLDHCYFQFKNSYKKAPCWLFENRTTPPFSSCQNIKWLVEEPLVCREMRWRTTQSEAIL